MPHKLGEMKAAASVSYHGKDRWKSFPSHLQMSKIFNRILIIRIKSPFSPQMALEWFSFCLKNIVVIHLSFTPAWGTKGSCPHFLSWGWKSLCNALQGFAEAQTPLAATGDPCPASPTGNSQRKNCRAQHGGKQWHGQSRGIPTVFCLSTTSCVLRQKNK